MAWKPLLRKRTLGNACFEQRIKVIRFLFLTAFFGIFLSLARIQLFNHQRYGSAVEKQGYLKVPIPVPRGRILDRNGRTLAMSVPVYALYLDAWKVRHAEKNDPEIRKRIAKELCAALAIPAAEMAKKFPLPYPCVKRDLTLDQYQALKESRLPGLVFTQTYKRMYPFKDMACHVVGCSNIDDRGMEGVELFYDKVLHGKEGLSVMMRDGEGRLIPSLAKRLIEPLPGQDIALTLDFSIQAIVEEEIENCSRQVKPASVSVVVMNPDNGEILALANAPHYDPNRPGGVPLDFRRNRAITDFFEPGSIFKIVTVTAGLEEGKVKPTEKIYCEKGKYFVRNHILHDAHPYGSLSVEDIVIKSSNIGTVKIAMKLGEEQLYSYCRKFRFGRNTGVDLPGEVPGILRPVSQWSGYSITAVPIGQEVGINAMQGIRAMAVLSNGGKLVTPHVLKEIRAPSGPILPDIPVPEQVISPATCETMTGILERVALPGGTAPMARMPGYRVCGKTGTAQKFEHGHYSGSKYVASFVGYVLKGDMKVIILVTVDEPKGYYYGGLVSAPVFRNIAWKIMQYWDVPPDENLKKSQLAMKKP